MAFVPDIDDEEETPAAPAAKPAGMSTEDMIGAALVALAPALLGGAMGGKQGALAGASAGSGAAGGALKAIGDDQKAAAAAKAKREQGFADFKEKADYQHSLKPDEKPKTTTITYRKGGKQVTEVVEATPGTTREGDIPPPKSGGKNTTTPDPKELRGAAERYRNKYTIESRPFVTALNSAKETENLAGMAKENPRAAGALMGKLARAAGEVGVLSDADIQRLGGSEALDERLKRFALLSTTDQKITDADIASAQQLAKAMQASARSNLDSLTEDQVSSFVSIYGGTPEEAHVKITGRAKQKPEEPAAGGPGQGGTPLSPKNIAALEWARDPKNVNDPHWPEVVAKLKRLGVIGLEQQTAGK